MTKLERLKELSKISPLALDSPEVEEIVFSLPDLIAAVEALEHYTGVVESVNDSNDFTPRVRDIGCYARTALKPFEE